MWLHPMNGSGLGKVGKQDQESDCSVCLSEQLTFLREDGS